MRKVHLIDLRLRVNAGMDFPTCQAGAKLLDTDKGRWELANVKDAVTCKKCLKAVKNGYWK
jgi:hypothetical protein